ncbi:uncharacterized protein SPAPADRAFT_144027, partial [Spathaspora passalidarum NRRL Y-27907]
SMSCQGDCSCKEPVVPIQSSQNIEDDDIWGDDDPKSLNDINRAHHKQGYLDGLVHQQEDSLQQGFDEGFPKGAELGVQVGRILSTLKLNNQDLFNQAKEELNIVNVLDRKYFDAKLNMNEEIPVIAKWLKIIHEL